MNEFVKKIVDKLEYNASDLTMYNNECYDICYNLDCKSGILQGNHEIIGIKYLDIVDENQILLLHKLYWNKNDVPISILVFKNEVRVYNNFNFDISNALLFSSLDSKKNKIKLEYLSNNSIISNVFEDKLKKIIKKTERVDIRLLKNLEFTINMISDATDGAKSDAFDFITKCILIKYLEDRKILVKDMFLKFNGKNFTEILTQGETTHIKNLFEYLKTRFNGEFFDISNNKILNYQYAISCVANFFNGEDVENGQLSLFPYDFSIIPIELISSIYEKFFNITIDKTQKSKKDAGAYYTPYFLADYIVNREITINEENYLHIKILDPACGSGIFLVGALKKFVDFYKNNELEIKSDVLHKIILNQIFGVDENINALKISEFSLYIALLDCLEPKDLEKNGFEFPKLIGNTLFETSFFSSKCLTKINKFDIILGNPPWKGREGDHVDYCKENNFIISDKQLAQAFIYRANDFIKPNGTICFILPNSIFCNSQSIHFRTNLLEINTIEEILNLSSINNNLFADAAFPCSIVKLKSTVKSNKISIVNFVPNIFSRLLNKIVFDFNSSANIDSSLFSKYDYLWNVSMSGSYYDFLLIKKIRETNYSINDLCKENNLLYSQGYAKAKQSKKYYEYKGYNILDNELVHHYIFKDKLENNTEVLCLERIHNKEQYESHNKVIFRRTLKANSVTNYAAIYKEKLLFNNKYYCIFDPTDCADELIFYYLDAIFNSKLYIYYQYHISAALKLITPEIRLDKVLDFPVMPYKPTNKLISKITNKCKEIEKLFLNLENCRKSILVNNIKEQEIYDEIELLNKEIDKIILKLYGIKEADIDVIDYTIKCLIPMARRKNLPVITEEELKQYCETMKKQFDTLLEFENLECIVKVYKSLSVITIIFKFNEKGGRQIWYEKIMKILIKIY